MAGVIGAIFSVKAIRSILILKRSGTVDYIMLAMSAACIVNIFVNVLLTEVMKRYFLDCWASFVIIIICGVAEVTPRVKEKLQHITKSRLVIPVLAAISLIGVYAVYSVNNINELRDFSLLYSDQENTLYISVPNYTGELFYTIDGSNRIPFSNDKTASINISSSGKSESITIIMSDKHEIIINGYLLR